MTGSSSQLNGLNVTSMPAEPFPMFLIVAKQSFFISFAVASAVQYAIPPQLCLRHLPLPGFIIFSVFVFLALQVGQLQWERHESNDDSPDYAHGKCDA